MLADNLKGHVDKAWDSLWSNGITNPISIIDVLGSLLIIQAGDNAKNWRSLENGIRNKSAAEIASIIRKVRKEQGISPGAEIENENFWKNAAGLEKAMESLRPLLSEKVGGDILGDIYEHILSKLSLAGQFGQFRTPRHIVDLMVAIANPREGEIILDPACGSGGFLVSASDFSKQKGVKIQVRGVEIDRTVARIAESNVIFHNILDGKVTNSDGLTDESVKANLVLANPPFSGSVSREVAKQFKIKTMKTEILFLEAITRQLTADGRAVVIVPLSLLTGGGASRNARKELVQGGHLRAVIELPIGVFRPYTDIRSAILFLDLATSSEQILMTRISNDGFSLDQKRRPVLGSDLPEVLKLINKEPSSLNHSFVPLEVLNENGINLSPSRYLKDLEKTLETLEEPEVILDRVARDLQSLVHLLETMKKEIR